MRSDIDGMTEAAFHLNEVLSIRAQELRFPRDHRNIEASDLNEVLSIRAQEFDVRGDHRYPLGDLNEVLSIRAQELPGQFVVRMCQDITSMKS